MRRHPATAPLLALLALPLGIRGLTALSTTVPATESIHAQQVQMGQFFQRYYAGRSVAVNDIGAVAWYSTSPLLDIVGLASQRVADLKRHDALDAGSLGTLADEQAVEAVAVYEVPFAAILPRSWVKVGEWTRASTIGVSERTVAFLARTDGDADRLRRALESYAAMLPNGVRWTSDIRAGAHAVIADATLRRVLPASTVALVGDLIRWCTWAGVAVVWVSFARAYFNLWVKTATQPGKNDYSIFYYTAQMVRDGLPMYGPVPAAYGFTWPAESLGNLNPPHFAVLTAPFWYLTYQQAFVLWLVGGLICLVLSVRIVWQELAYPRSLPLMLVVGAALLSCAPFVLVASTGELTYFLLLP